MPSLMDLLHLDLLHLNLFEWEPGKLDPEMKGVPGEKMDLDLLLVNPGQLQELIGQ